MTDARVQNFGVEYLGSYNANVRVQYVGVERLSGPYGPINAAVREFGIEVLYSVDGAPLGACVVRNFGVEVLYSTPLPPTPEAIEDPAALLIGL